MLLALAACAGSPDAHGLAGAEVGLAPVEHGHLWYAVRGQGSTVVLVNGGGLDHRQWQPLAALLAERHRVVLYDGRGWGASTPPERPYAPHDDLARLLEHLGPGPAHVVGLSWGAGVALDLALTRPERVASLALVAPTLAGHQWSRDFAARTAALARVSERGGHEALVEALLDDPWFAPGAEDDAALAARLRELLRAAERPLRMDPDLVRGASPPALRRLGEVAVPALVVTPLGEHDDTRQLAARVHDELPDARRATVAGAGQMVALEKPALLAGMLAAFFAEVDDARAERHGDALAAPAGAATSNAGRPGPVPASPVGGGVSYPPPPGRTAAAARPDDRTPPPPAQNLRRSCP